MITLFTGGGECVRVVCVQVDVVNRSTSVDLANYVFNGEWELLSVGVKRNEIVYACCVEPYPDVTFTIVIRRRTLYYLFNVIFPCLWLTALSLVGFWLPPDSGEKITLGITVLLAFSVFMLMIAENMPATSEFVPLMGTIHHSPAVIDLPPEFNPGWKNPQTKNP